MPSAAAAAPRIAGTKVHLTKSSEHSTLGRFNHLNAAVRCDAVQTIGNSTLVGDEGAINAVIPLLDDDDASVRRAAIKAVMNLALRGNLRAATAVAARLGDVEPNARRLAVAAVERMAGPRGPGGEAAVVQSAPAVIEVALAVTKSRIPGARLSAIDAIGRVASRGDARAVEEVERCLLHTTSRQMRAMATNAFVKVASLDLAEDRLQNSESEVLRNAAALTLDAADESMLALGDAAQDSLDETTLMCEPCATFVTEGDSTDMEPASPELEVSAIPVAMHEEA